MRRHSSGSQTLASGPPVRMLSVLIRIVCKSFEWLYSNYILTASYHYGITTHVIVARSRRNLGCESQKAASPLERMPRDSKLKMDLSSFRMNTYTKMRP